MPCVKTCEMEEPVRPAILCCDRPLMNRRPALCFEERYDGIQQLRGKCQITIQNVFFICRQQAYGGRKDIFFGEYSRLENYAFSLENNGGSKLQGF